MSRIAWIARNISANYIGTIVPVAITIFLTPFVIHHLGAVAYGIWVLVHSISFYINFLDLGMYSALVKYTAEYTADEQKGELDKLIGTALVFFLGAGILALGASLLIAYLLISLFHVPEDFIHTFQVVIVLFGVDILISFPGSIFDGILQGKQRFDILNIVGTAFHILGAVATVVLLMLGNGLIALALLEIASSLIGILVDVLIIKKLYPSITFSLGLFNRETWRKAWDYSFWSFLNGVVNDGVSELDKPLIPVFLSVALVAPYSVACSLASVVYMAVSPIVGVFFPLASEFDGSADRESLQKLLLQGSKFVLGISLPVSVFVFFMGESIINNWVGPEYTKISPYVLRLVLISFLIAVFFWTPVKILSGMARLREMFLFTCFEVTLAVVLIFLTIKKYELVGLATSFLLANTIVSFGCLLPFTCKTLRISVVSYLLESMVKPLIPALPTALVAFFLVRNFYPGSWSALALEGGTLLLVYITGFLFLSFSKSERGKVYQQAKRLFSSRL